LWERESMGDPQPRDLDLTHWRCQRTLRSIACFSTWREGERHELHKGLNLVGHYAWLYERTLTEAILFDYEKRYIDQMEEQGLIERTTEAGTRFLRLTKKGWRIFAEIQMEGTEHWDTSEGYSPTKRLDVAKRKMKLNLEN